MKENISIEEAVSSLLANVSLPAEETIRLEDACGRVISGDIAASLDLPPFDRSVYDGFAFRAGLTEQAGDGTPAVLPVTGAIMAGDFRREPLAEGCAVRIMTGAALPEGADCVINFERVADSGDTIRIREPLKPGQNVDHKGDEIRRGSPLFHKGEKLTPSHLGVLASQGMDRVRVYRKPRAAILSSGSELMLPGVPLDAGKIYNSNLHVLRALLAQEGFEVTECIHEEDNCGSICRTLRRLAGEADLILTTGGASVGDKDYAASALRMADAGLLFSHIRMKPGSCCYGAVLDRSLVISLSGNPGAALTAYYRVALPAIRKMTGRRDYQLREGTYPLASPCARTCPHPRILKGHLEVIDGTTQFVAHEGQKNGMQMSFLHMTALAELPPTTEPLREGTPARVWVF